MLLVEEVYLGQAPALVKGDMALAGQCGYTSK